MHKYAHALQPFFRGLAVAYQQDHHCTNSRMADLLAISSRAYSDLKGSKSGLSAAALCTFLAHVSEEERAQTVQDLVDAINAIEENGWYEA